MVYNSSYYYLFPFSCSSILISSTPQLKSPYSFFPFSSSTSYTSTKLKVINPKSQFIIWWLNFLSWTLDIHAYSNHINICEQNYLHKN